MPLIWFYLENEFAAAAADFLVTLPGVISVFTIIELFLLKEDDDEDDEVKFPFPELLFIERLTSSFENWFPKKFNKSLEAEVEVEIEIESEEEDEDE